ncbi:hypothetical protein G8759_22345 [Spirosoma aureum]|uniref:Uncharacterized protein n=1 Tax=Spirosoma aureum TaxID=2692134 RepID=A0A6G9AS56_9BACT|nr:hypothetical protein [Spirosoma aureum]QIP15166.1 hypothetical protein G8759_22345 [Spirosoma aureum]
MKRILLIAALSGLSLITASAQDDNKVRNDHTYSTHNYKHANKAATARQWENKSGASVRAPGLGTAPLANYKHQVPGAVPTGGVVLPHTPETDVALRNYKIQRVSLPNSTTRMVAKTGDSSSSKPNAQTGQ